MLQEIVCSDLADLVVWVQARPSGRVGSPNFLESRLSKYLSSRERALRIFHDAFSVLGGFECPSNVKCVPLVGHDDFDAEEFVSKAIGEVEECAPDFLIALDHDVAMEKFASIGKYGLWYFRHGVNAHVSGSHEETAGLIEVLDRHRYLKTSLVLYGGSIPGGRQTCDTYSYVNPVSYRRTRSEHFWKVSVFAPRIMKRICSIGAQSTFGEMTPDSDFHDRMDFGRNNIAQIRYVIPFAKYTVRRILGGIRRRFTSERWILMVNSRGDRFDLENYAKIKPRKGYFWADPFLCRENKQLYVFFEEAPVDTGKGHIAVIKLHEDGSYSSPSRIIERDYHLSYPFVFRWQKTLYMVPESAENRTIELYRCDRFPNKWVFERNLMQDISAYDATLFEHDGIWWMFASIQEHEGASPSDELSLFFTDNPVLGKWQSHPMNPVVSDIRSARPGGRLFMEDGRLIRPSQDSSYRYGFRLKFNEILELSKTRYRERVLNCIEPGSSLSIRAIHSFSQCGDIAVIDAIHRSPDLAGLR